MNRLLLSIIPYNVCFNQKMLICFIRFQLTILIMFSFCLLLKSLLVKCYMFVNYITVVIAFFLILSIYNNEIYLLNIHIKNRIKNDILQYEMIIVYIPVCRSNTGSYISNFSFESTFFNPNSL